MLLEILARPVEIDCMKPNSVHFYSSTELPTVAAGEDVQARHLEVMMEWAGEKKKRKAARYFLFACETLIIHMNVTNSLANGWYQPY